MFITRNQTSLHTTARLSLGRASSFVSTKDNLQFQLDHARARDAVHALADFHTLAAALTHRGTPPLQLESAIPPGPAARQQYLRRPDLGRRLSPESAARLREHAALLTEKPLVAPIDVAPIDVAPIDVAPIDVAPIDVALIIADGLSALAVDRNALPLLEALAPFLTAWNPAPITLVRNARVAIGDEIGEILNAKLTILLIGERPGLTAPDSLGVYLTWKPRLGNTDADRNCISNIRHEGLSYAEAAARIAFYANAARASGYSGFTLKESGSPNLPPVR